MERGREPPEHAVRADRILAAAGELLLRQVTEVTRELVAGMRADPTEVLLRRVTSVSFQAIMQRPLARALYTRDLDILGKLAVSDTAGVAARQQVAGALFDEYVDLMRAHGLLRTDIDRQTQRYVWNAVGTGFFVTEQFLLEQLQEISLGTQGGGACRGHPASRGSPGRARS